LLWMVASMLFRNSVPAVDLFNIPPEKARQSLLKWRLDAYRRWLTMREPKWARLAPQN
jgi:hypothetical protein